MLIALKQLIVKVSPSWPSHQCIRCCYSIFFLFRLKYKILNFSFFVLLTDTRGEKMPLKSLALLSLLESTTKEGTPKIEQQLSWNWGRKYCSAWRSNEWDDDSGGRNGVSTFCVKENLFDAEKNFAWQFIKLWYLLAFNKATTIAQWPTES